MRMAQARGLKVPRWSSGSGTPRAPAHTCTHIASTSAASSSSISRFSGRRIAESL